MQTQRVIVGKHLCVEAPIVIFLVVDKLRTEQTIECRVNKDLTVLAGT